MAKLKYTNAVLPKGIAKRCFINKPSAPFDKGGREQYKVTVLIEDTAENRDYLNSVVARAADEAKAQGVKLKKNYGVAIVYPEDHDPDDFEAAEGAQYPKLDEDFRDRIAIEAKSGFKPALIDSAKQTLPEDVAIYRNDVIRVKIEPNPYEGFGSGISFRLKVVQLIAKDTSYPGSGTNTDGFDEEEGGYVAPSKIEDDEDAF